jgi:Zn-dependent protease with chaperone function
MKPAMLPVEVDGYSTMKISTGKSSWVRAMFSSHPPLEDRIDALEKLVIN